MAKKLLSADEVADRLSVSKDTVRRLYLDGRLEKVRISKRTIRYTEDSVNDYIQANSYQIV